MGSVHWIYDTNMCLCTHRPMELAKLMKKDKKICCYASLGRTMPQGMRNATVVFQSLMDLVLKGIPFKYVMVYIDDIFVSFLVHLSSICNNCRNYFNF